MSSYSFFVISCFLVAPTFIVISSLYFTFVKAIGFYGIVVK